MISGKLWFLAALMMFTGGCSSSEVKEYPSHEEIHGAIDKPNSHISNLLERFVAAASYEPDLPRGQQITPPPDRIVDMLMLFKESGKDDHLPFLVEYGLKLHWINLKHTNLARELPVKENTVIAELIRLTGIRKYKTAHEAGWLNRQFDHHFDREGWSSYQIYIWLKEQGFAAWDLYPNTDRINALLKAIENSGKNGVGGSGVCHYGCK